MTLKGKTVENDVVQFNEIITQNGVYISILQQYNYSKCSKYFFDGKSPEPTFHTNWFKIEKSPSLVEEIIPERSSFTNRFILIDPSLCNDKIPSELLAEDVLDEDDDWSATFEHLKSLYKREELIKKSENKVINFKIANSITLDSIEQFNGFSYPIRNKGTITQRDVKHNELDCILFPDIVLDSRLCKLSSQDSYEIVREFVKNNIDPKVALISSDYDFCFTVEKRIKLYKPESYKVNVNIHGKKPKYEIRERDHKCVKCFEMTYSPKNYDNYTPIPGFEGKNLEDLNKNIHAFLTDLIQNINSPTVVCEHCKGLGILVTHFKFNSKE